MSNLASAAAALPGVPEDLVQRSADARAAASGGSAEDILAAWGGGAPAPEAPAPAAAPVEAADIAAPVAAATAVAVAEAPIAEVATEVVELEQELEEVIEPAAARARLKKGRQLGLGFGLAAGLVALLLGLALFLPNLSIVDDVVVGLVAPRKIVFGLALLLGGTGWLVAGAVARVPAAINKRFFLDAPSRDVKITGLVTGLVLGLGLGTLIKKTGVPDILDPTLFVLPLMSSIGTALVGAGMIGAITGMLVQIVGLPDALGTDDGH